MNVIPPFESAIYRGGVRHRRFTPTTHEFDFSLFMLWLKLDELPRVLERFWPLGRSPLHWGRFRRQDYLPGVSDTPGEEVSLSQAVKRKVAELGATPDQLPPGEVFMLGHLRYLGHYFSPLTLYFIRHDGHYTHMLAEVSNTPWKERHYYLQDMADIRSHPKAFHVSPFNPMTQTYHWRIEPPAAESPRCLIHLETHSDGGPAEKVFDATLMLERHPLNQRELIRVLLRTPMQTASIVAGIHWQALKLFLKRTPLYPHPTKQNTEPQQENKTGESRESTV